MPCVDHHESATVLAHYCSFSPAEVGKFFVGENLVTAQTQLRLYSEQQEGIWN